MKRALALAALAGTLVSAAAARAGTGDLTLRFLHERVTADENGAWTLDVSVADHSSFGVFGDSLYLSVRPARRDGRATKAIAQKLPVLTSLKSLSAGDSVEASLAVRAIADSAVLELTLYGHDHAGALLSASATVVAAGSVLDQRYPPEAMLVKGRRIELADLAPGETEGPATGVLLLPAEDSSRSEALVTASRLARAGYHVLVCRLEGTGTAGALDDFAGPVSLEAASAALDTLARRSGAAPGRIAAWGVSRGGTVALRLAHERPLALGAVVAQGASFDLWASYRAAGPEGRQAIVAAAGRDSAGWAMRSPLRIAGTFRTPAIVLHGEGDEVFPASAAHAFVDAARAAGAPVTGSFAPRAQHQTSLAPGLRFLQEQWRSAP